VDGLRGYGLAFWMLMALATALLAVGVANHSAARHLIQAAPTAIAMLLILTQVSGGRYFAGAVFAVWILATALIFLHLPGIADVVNGDSPTVERVLAAVIGIVSLIGAVSAFGGAKVPVKTGILFFLLGAAVQVVAIEVSVGPLFPG
jgi:hypothetical protein